MKDPCINEQGIEDINDLVREVVEDKAVAGAIKLQQLCECGVTQVDVIICTPDLARVAQLAIQEHLEGKKGIVFDNAVE